MSYLRDSRHDFASICTVCGAFYGDGHDEDEQCPGAKPKATDEQVGGDHYKNMAIQPIERLMNDISDDWDLRIVRTWRCSICGHEESSQQGLRYNYTPTEVPYVPERWSLIKGELVCPKHKITADTLDGGTIQWIPGDDVTSHTADTPQ